MNRKYTCEDCGESFDNFRGIQVHKGKIHKEPSEEGKEFESLSFKSKRKRILERDNYSCVECGMTENEHKNKYNCSLDIHHLESRVDGDYNNDNKENLITVCQKCHVDKYDRNGIRVYE